jgi:hypothetical protein
MRAWFLVPCLLLVTASCFPGACRPTSGSCSVGTNVEQPELATRAEVILDILADNPSALESVATKHLAEITPRAQIESSAEALAAFLARPRTLGSIWAVRGNGFVPCKTQDGVVEGLHVPADDAGERTVVFYDVSAGDHGDRLILVLKREQGELRLDFMYNTASRYRDKEAADFERLADAAAKAGHDGDALLLYLVAEQLSAYPPIITNGEHRRISNKLEVFAKGRMERFLSKERIPREHPWLHVAVEPAADYVLMPVVSFVSSQKSSDEPAKELFAHLDGHMPALREHFSFVAFKAYAEPATDPNHFYQSWGTLIPLGTP